MTKRIRKFAAALAAATLALTQISAAMPAVSAKTAAAGAALNPFELFDFYFGGRFIARLSGNHGRLGKPGVEKRNGPLRRQYEKAGRGHLSLRGRP